METAEKVIGEIEKEESKEPEQCILDEAKKKELIEKSKKYSLKDAGFVNGTVGFGDNYISAYGVALNASPTQIGLLTSMPNLFAPFAGLMTHKFMEKNPRKKIFGLSILLQSLMWLPIIFVSFLFLKNITYAPLLLVLFYTIYALFGNFASPAWISWIGDLVIGKESGRFFGLRNKIGGVTALISMIIAGLILDLFRKTSAINSSYVFIGFGLIFFIAMIFRFVSRHYVLKQYEPEIKLKKENYFSFSQFLKAIPKSNYGRFALYISLIVLATNIAGPFYTIYMLRDLGFSYFYFMLIQVAAALALFLFMSKWGNFSDRYGNIITIKITAYLVPIVCFLWPVSVFIAMPFKFYFLMTINFFSGFAWAGFNLAAGNFVFDAATPQKRGLCSAYSAVMNGFGVVIGTTIGSLIISYSNISFMNVILFVSLVSGIARFLVSFAMVSEIKEVREVENKPRWNVVPFASEIYNIHSHMLRGVAILRRKKKEGA